MHKHVEGKYDWDENAKWKPNQDVKTQVESQSGSRWKGTTLNIENGSKKSLSNTNIPKGTLTRTRDDVVHL